MLKKSRCPVKICGKVAAFSVEQREIFTEDSLLSQDAIKTNNSANNAIGSKLFKTNSWRNCQITTWNIQDKPMKNISIFGNLFVFRNKENCLRKLYLVGKQYFQRVGEDLVHTYFTPVSLTTARLTVALVAGMNFESH